MVGDGMGVATVTAARIHRGALDGLDQPVQGRLRMDDAPRAALVRTYSADQMTTDSAAGMTAMVAGAKVPNGVLSVNRDTGDTLITVLELAEAMGLSTGIVSTTRITHATPAACYAHVESRNWHLDIASALVPGTGNPRLGDGIEVVLGGGRRYFRTESQGGQRTDGRDLMRELSEAGYRVVETAQELDGAVEEEPDRLLGLFANKDMGYEADRVAMGLEQPSLAAMTAAAIRILEKNPRGYFLMVEGGRIDHALHSNYGYRAVRDMLAFDEAVGVVLDRVDGAVVVTSDHDHTMVVAGYAGADEDVFSQAGVDDVGKPYSVILYATGPSASLVHPDTLSGDLMRRRNFQERAGIPKRSEAHGAMDVPLYAWGPKEWLDGIPGSMNNIEIFDLLKQALGIE